MTGMLGTPTIAEHAWCPFIVIGGQCVDAHHRRADCGRTGCTPRREIVV